METIEPPDGETKKAAEVSQERDPSDWPQAAYRLVTDQFWKILILLLIFLAAVLTAVALKGWPAFGVRGEGVQEPPPIFTGADWAAFAAGLHAGEFDLR